MDTHTHKAKEVVRQFRKSKGLSINRFAKMAGIFEGSIRKIDSPEWSPTAKTLEKLEKATLKHKSNTKNP